MANRNRRFARAVLFRWLVVLMFACLLRTAMAQEEARGSIFGTVTDKSGEALPYAQVTARNEATGQTLKTYANSMGDFAFPRVPVGTYDIAASSKEHKTAKRTVVVGADEAPRTDFELDVGGGIPPAEVGSGTVVPSRALLSDDAPEGKGFGLYSYILFGSPPNDATRERYLAVLRSFLDIQPVRELTKTIPLKQLNVTYVPVKGQEEPTSAEELLRVYDYARAIGLMARISCAQGEAPCGPYLAGPYILSTTKPLSGQPSLAHHFLYQDLSSVPARIVPLWVDEFMKQSSQPDFWRKRNGPQVALDLRTAIAVLGDSIPDLQSSADEWKKALATMLTWR